MIPDEMNGMRIQNIYILQAKSWFAILDVNSS